MQGWKKVLLASFGFGAGAAVAAASIIGFVSWYSTRPTPPKPWNRTAIRATEPPTFSTAGEDSHLKFAFTLLNNTEHDYEVDKDRGGMKVMLRYKDDDSLRGPFEPDAIKVAYPIFIPTRQKVDVFVEVLVMRLKQESGENDEAYHERLRTYLNTQWDSLKEFVFFDDVNRYEIGLPRWLDKPKEPAPTRR